MRLRGGEMVYYRLKIRLRSQMLQKLVYKKLKEVLRHLESPSKERSILRDNF